MAEMKEMAEIEDLTEMEEVTIFGLIGGVGFWEHHQGCVRQAARNISCSFT